MPVIASRGAASASGFGASAPYHQPAIIFSSSSIGIRAYAWSDATGIGEQYAAPPGTYSGGSQFPRGVNIPQAQRDPNGPIIVNIPSQGSNGYNAYEWNGLRGFVKKYAEPAVYTNFAYMQAWSGDRTRVATGTSSSPYFGLYEWSDAGYGAKLVGSGTPPSASPGNGTTMLTSPDGNWWIQVGDSSSGKVQPYKFATALVYGTRSAAQAPSWSSTGSVLSLCFHPVETSYIIYTTSNSNSPTSGANIGGWYWSNDTGFTAGSAGQFYVGANGNGAGIGAFNPSGTHYILQGQRQVTGRIGYITVFNWNGGGSMSLMAEPPSGTTLTGFNSSVCQPSFNKKETYVVVAASVAPYYSIYAWSNTTGLGARQSVPDLGSTGGLSVKFI